MPNVAKVLKEEISRIARKEAKQAVNPVRKPGIATRRDVAFLKRKVAALEKIVRQLMTAASKTSAVQAPAATEEGGTRARITAKGMRSLRRRLGLSQADFAKLLGVTAQAIYILEKRSGALRVRNTTKAAYLGLRGVGAREARRRLDKLAAVKSTGKPGKAVRRRKAR